MRRSGGRERLGVVLKEGVVGDLDEVRDAGTLGRDDGEFCVESRALATFALAGACRRAFAAGAAGAAGCIAGCADAAAADSDAVPAFVEPPTPLGPGCGSHFELGNVPLYREASILTLTLTLTSTPWAPPVPFLVASIPARSASFASEPCKPLVACLLACLLAYTQGSDWRHLPGSKKPQHFPQPSTDFRLARLCD